MRMYLCCCTKRKGVQGGIYEVYVHEQGVAAGGCWWLARYQVQTVTYGNHQRGYDLQTGEGIPYTPQMNCCVSTISDRGQSVPSAGPELVPEIPNPGC